jgi:hypothetical protein
MPLHLNVTFLTHRNMQRYIEKYAVTSIVTLNCNGKDHLRYRYYRYRMLNNKALQVPWQFLVTRDRDRYSILKALQALQIKYRITPNVIFNVTLTVTLTVSLTVSLTVTLAFTFTVTFTTT